MRPTERFLALDSLRGVCACLVAVAHFPALSLSNHIPMLARGDVYVDFFFVLSGFVIFHSYSARLSNTDEVRQFLWARFWRLWPLHITVLAVFLAIEGAQLLLPMGAENAPFTAPGEDIGTVLASVFLVHSLGPWPAQSFNWPSWSISVEAWTYVVFAFAVMLLPKRWPIAMAAIACAGAVCLYLLHGELFAMTDYGLLRCLYGFSCGIGAYKLYHALRGRGQRNLTAAEVALAAVVLLYCNFLAFGAPSMFAPLLFIGVVVVFALQRGAISKALTNPLPVEIGNRSYSIYMLHILIAGKLFFTPAVLVERFGVTLTSARENGPVFGTDLITGTVAEIAFLLIVVWMAGWTYRLIELPGQALGKKMRSGKKVEAAA